MARLRIPEVLTESEQKVLLAQPNPRYPTGERNLLIMRIMLDAGLRLSEAINLKWVDLDLMTGKLHVKQGKGGKDRILWLGEEDLELLRHWRERQAQVVSHAPEHVFTTLNGKPLQPRYVQAMVARYAKRAGSASGMRKRGASPASSRPCELEHNSGLRASCGLGLGARPEILSRPGGGSGVILWRSSPRLAGVRLFPAR